MKKAIAILSVLIMLVSAVAAAETLTVGSSIDFAPYEYYDDETGDIVGIDVEIAYAVMEKLGCELEIQDMQFDSIIAAIVSGKVDFGMSGFTITEERKQSVDFSTPYTTTVQSVIVPEGSEITCIDDLYNADANYNVGVQQGTTGDLYITEDLEAKDMGNNIQRFNKATDTIPAIQSGKIDCIIIDEQVAKAFIANNEGLKLLDTAYAYEEYAFCFPKDSAIFADFDTALQELLADGTVQGIIDKYIEE